MDSNQESDAPPQELVPGHDEILEELRLELTAWCEARPAAASLDIAAAYDELRCLDIEQQSWLLRVVPEPAVMDEYYDAPPRAAPSPGIVLWRAKNDVIKSVFQHWEQLLRSRALELSRDRLRSLKITDLPLEILRIIFDQFQDHTVANSGMWCRDASLNLAEMISKSPAIAAGVRGIHISLAYRPKQHANSLFRYMHTRLAALQKHERYFNYEIAPHRYRGPEEEEEEDERTKAMRQALDNCRRLRDEWREYLRAVFRGGTPNEPLSKYQEILQRGHAEFRRLHQEQWQLLQNGTFSNTLASIVARMPNARSFIFVDEFDPDAGYDEDICLSSTEMLSRFMPTPLSWQEAEDGRGEADGAELQCVFDLHLPRGKWFRGNTAAKDHKSDIDEFLGAVLARCGRHLRVLELNLFGFTISSGRGSRHDDQFYDAEGILTNLQELPKLRSLRLNHVDLQEKTLHGLCSGIGRHLTWLSTYNVRLRSGLWADTIAVLRQKIAATGARRGRPGARHVSFINLQGGEFDAVPSIASTPSDAGDSAITNCQRDRPLLEDLGRYVMGNLEHNPLRDSQKPWQMSLDVCTCAYGARYPCIKHL
ncbi:hypothetical protein C8A01DRAFT_18179 [Parachaetomium inaequale]|uniref:Uncharacterized protein n=1 Tax=Parachaetomium inaequale TaxID=2588326 RepID=A0AAN6SPA7_9PEZI|nr:hypothetical protein C8A01DRAFT_18179 [Parachaetomium inaequale]